MSDRKNAEPEHSPLSYDVLISGGEVIDPGTGTAGQYDVAIKDGKVALVAESIPADLSARVIDATGQIVTPGLLDLHTHVYLSLIHI